MIFPDKKKLRKFFWNRYFGQIQMQIHLVRKFWKNENVSIFGFMISDKYEYIPVEEMSYIDSLNFYDVF